MGVERVSVFRHSYVKKTSFIDPRYPWEL